MNNHKYPNLTKFTIDPWTRSNVGPKAVECAHIKPYELKADFSIGAVGDVMRSRIDKQTTDFMRNICEMCGLKSYREILNRVTFFIKTEHTGFLRAAMHIDNKYFLTVERTTEIICDPCEMTSYLQINLKVVDRAV